MPVVGANRVLGVEVNIGRQKHGPADEGQRPVDSGGAGSAPHEGGDGYRSSAVQVRCW